MRQTLVIAIVLAYAGTAAADKADALFKKGKKLLGEKHYAEACAAFEDSDKLESGIGTRLNIAKCYEEWGKLAVAYRWYEAAEAMAVETKDARAVKIHQLAEELDGNVPRLTIKLPAGAATDGLVVNLDGKPTTIGELVEQRVDPGPHVIDYEINGTKKTKIVPVERGGSSEVTLDVPKATAKPTPEVVVKPPPIEHPITPLHVDDDANAHPGRTRRIAGVVVAAAGGVAIGVAGFVTLHARSRYRDALAANCDGDPTMCDPDGLATTHDARHQANIATVVTIVGAAAVVGGIVLYVTAPSGSHRAEHALYLSPAISRDGAALVLGGRY